jgi:CHASE2 domain-containing sensor protein
VKIGAPDFLAIVRFLRAQVVSLSMVVVLAGAGYFIDEHKQWFPWLIDLQSHALRVMTWADPRVRRADHVTVVEIDDATYRERHLTEPTDRRFVAELIRDAGRANAAVVMLDLNLVYTPGQPSGDDVPAQMKANAALLDAIRATVKHDPPIPVILAVALQQGEDGEWRELRNIFPDGALPVADSADGLPPRAAVGYASGASDSRQVPLVIDAHVGTATGFEPFWSLSLRTADAYDSVLDIVPTASEKPAIHDAIANGEFVYGTFLPESAFSRVSAEDLAKGVPAARAALDHRIVIIGGVRHDPITGGMEDEHDTPLGPMIGAYIHANWIEAILDQRVKRPVPWWVAIAVDLALGISMVVLSARARTTADQFGLVALFAIPIAIAYVAFVDLEYSLDFTLPLLVLMVHLILDKYRELGHRQHATSPRPAETATDVG